ncbi:MAG: GTP-binding protein [Bacillaceae bacterium]|nr:GTP-binding protein [Bacillaceae bacterium]
MTMKIPVIILSGFLGSGKTTLLERLLNECLHLNIKPAVLMNEIGKTDTDGSIINNKVNIMEKLLDGCICCNKKSEVVSSLLKLLSLQPNILFIELTGVANPVEVIDSLTEPMLKEKLYLHNVITLIDSENILSYNNIFESDRELVNTTRSQLEAADLLIVNKIDLVPENKVVKIEKLIKKYNKTASSFFVTHCNIDVQKLMKEVFSIHITRAISNNASSNKLNKSFTKIKSLTLPIHFQTTKEDVESFLKIWKNTVIRAKGYVPLKEGTYLMQRVMKRGIWEKTDSQQEHYLVLIGIDLNEDLIKNKWDSINNKQPT